MSNEGKAARLPKLQFPEFRISSTWTDRKLNELLFEAKQRNRNLEFGPSDVLSVSGEFGCVNQIELLGRSYAGASVKDYHVVENGDLVYTKSPLKKNPYGIIKENRGKRGIVSTLYAVYRPLPTCSPSYLDHFFSGDYNLNSYLQPIVKKGPKNDMKVNNAEVLTGDICVPEIKEQTRIADCLSSLDELIAAQARKVDALNRHKEDLAKRIFPRAGETQPRLRFPEFRDVPGWERSSLGRVFETTSGGTPSRSEASYWNGNIPWITTSLVDFCVIREAEQFITEEGLNNSSAKRFPKGTVLIAMYGQGKTRGQVALLDIEAATNQACAAVLPKAGIEPYFVFLNLSSRYEELRKLSNSGGQENLSQGLIRDLPFSYPLDVNEQKSIVDCLTALNDLINTVVQELGHLRAHKRGLMQQLFPSVETAA